MHGSRVIMRVLIHFSDFKAWGREVAPELSTSDRSKLGGGYLDCYFTTNDSIVVVVVVNI